MSRWSKQVNLDTVLARLKVSAKDILAPKKRPRPDDIEPFRLPFELKGNSAQRLSKHEARLQQPMPPEIRRLYEVIGGIRFSENPMLYIMELTETKWYDVPELEYPIEKHPRRYGAWGRCNYFLFAATSTGDACTWCDHPPGRPAGSVILIDHEGLAGPKDDKSQPREIVVLGDSLAQWLARWLDLGLVEYAFTEATALQQVPVQLQRDFLEDHLRLNPGIRWARDALTALEGDKP